MLIETKFLVFPPFLQFPELKELWELKINKEAP